jgi:hypothetical protein
MVAAIRTLVIRQCGFVSFGCWKAGLATEKNLHRGGQLVVRERIFSSGQLKILGNQPWWTAL